MASRDDTAGEGAAVDESDRELSLEPLESQPTVDASTLNEGRPLPYAATTAADTVLADSQSGAIARGSDPWSAYDVPSQPRDTLRTPGGVIGAELPQRYLPEQPLGEGGFGRVEAVFDRQLERSVALKELLPPEGITDELTVSAIMRGREARFVNEARITGKLEHPGIVPIYEMGRRRDGHLYYVMRLIEGQDFERTLRGAPFAARLKLLPHFVDACQAVAYAHSRGVIHRDLKPENIMIGDYGETLVVDWGLAKVRGQEDLQETAFAEGIERLRHQSDVRTIEGMALGTPSYMPPEQCLGQLDEIDERADVYALGAVLYHLLTGQPPHGGETIEQIIKATIRDPVVPPSELEPSCPQELEAIALRALSIDKEDRYPNAGALAKDIRAFLDGELVRAHRYTWRERAGRWVRAHRLRLLAVAMLILGAGGAWLYTDHTAQLRAERLAADRAAAAEAAERARREELLTELDAIITETATGNVMPRWLETHAFKIISLGEPVAATAIEERLIRELEHPSRDVRRLAARSLSGIHRTHAVEALSNRLVEEGETDEDVLVEIVNTLGVIGDPRAEKPVADLRWRKGQNSPFWEQTKLAYRLIPLPDLSEGSDVLTAEGWNDRGKALVHKGRRDEAIDAYTKAIEKAPKDARGYNNRAIEYARLELFDLALADYTKAIELDEDGGKFPRYNRAVLKRKIDDFEGAIEDYGALVDQGFRLPTVLRGRAVAHRYAGDHEAALDDLERAIEESPRDPRTYSAMATVYGEMGRWRDAVQAASQAISINPEYVVALISRANAHRMLGERVAAQADLDRAIDLDPVSDYARLARAALRLHLGDAEGAAEDLSHCIDKSCTEDDQSMASRLYYRAAVLHAQREDWDAAQRDLMRAFGFAPRRSQQVQLALAGAIVARRQSGRENQRLWQLRLEPQRSDLFHERLLRVAAGQESFPAMMEETKAEARICALLIAGGLEREIAGDIEGARERYAMFESVGRPIDPDCVMAYAASIHHPTLQ